MTKKQTVKIVGKGNVNKAMVVAQDVLAHLKLLDITPGTYCEGHFPDEGKFKASEQASKYIDGLSKNCNVCAVGACFLSYVRVYNKVQLNEFVGGRTGIDPGDGFSLDYAYMTDLLRNVFTAPQLELIEAAFEQTVVNDDYVINKDDIKDDNYDYDDDPFLYDYDPEEHCTQEEMYAAERFGEKYDTPTDRLKAIMQNIVKNDGVFIPDPKVHKLLEKKKAAGAEYEKAKEQLDEARKVLEAAV